MCARDSRMARADHADYGIWPKLRPKLDFKNQTERI